MATKSEWVMLGVVLTLSAFVLAVYPFALGAQLDRLRAIETEALFDGLMDRAIDAWPYEGAR